MFLNTAPSSYPDDLASGVTDRGVRLVRHLCGGRHRWRSAYGTSCPPRMWPHLPVTILSPLVSRPYSAETAARIRSFGTAAGGTPQACPSTPPRSRCCDDRYRRPLVGGQPTRPGRVLQVGYAPPGWTALVDHLRTRGYTDPELLDAGVVMATSQAASASTPCSCTRVVSFASSRASICAAKRRAPLVSPEQPDLASVANSSAPLAALSPTCPAPGPGEGHVSPVPYVGRHLQPGLVDGDLVAPVGYAKSGFDAHWAGADDRNRRVPTHLNGPPVADASGSGS